MSARRAIAAVTLTAVLATLAMIGAPTSAQAQAGVTNTCPASDISVALYGGSVSVGLVAGNRFLDEDAGFCVQVITEAEWSAMTVAEFRLFDVLWIGNDDCGGSDASDFDVAAATVATWEVAIDPGSVMVAGGDYDYHYVRSQPNAIEVTQAMVTEISDAAAPGLVLQAGCYAVGSPAPWFQNLGGTFTGLGHAHTSNGDPSASEVYTAHEFNTKYGFDSASYNFGASCHGGISIAAGSPVENYQLQPLFDFNNAPCFMFSDATVAPTFVGDIGGTIWCDTANPNLALDAGEELAGVTVSLTDAAAAVQTATTGADGSYVFADQPVGTYTITVDTTTLPADCNAVAVAPDGGSDASVLVTTTVSEVSNTMQDFGFEAGVAGPTPTPTPTVAPTPGPTAVPTVDPIAYPDITVKPVMPAGPLDVPAVGMPAEPLETVDEVKAVVVDADTSVLAYSGNETRVLGIAGTLALGIGLYAVGSARLVRRRD